MNLAGAGVTSPDRIVLLRDANGSGIAQMKTVFLSGLHSPFGMALVGNELYVADTDALLSFDYTTGATQNHRHWAPSWPRFARRPDQSPLDEECCRGPHRQASLHHGRLEQATPGENGIEAESDTFTNT